MSSERFYIEISPNTGVHHVMDRREIVKPILLREEASELVCNALNAQEPSPSHDLVAEFEKALGDSLMWSGTRRRAAAIELVQLITKAALSGVIVSRECAEDCRTLQRARAVTNSLFPESEETTEIINKAIKYAEEIEQALGVER